MSGTPVIRAFFDEPTNTVSYLVADPHDQARRHHRPRFGLRPEIGHSRCPFRQVHARGSRSGGVFGRVVARDARARRPPVRLALCEGKDRRQDRHRRKYQGGAANLPARCSTRPI